MTEESRGPEARVGAERPGRATEGSVEIAVPPRG